MIARTGLKIFLQLCYFHGLLDNWSIESLSTMIVENFSQDFNIVEHIVDNNHVSYSLWGQSQVVHTLGKQLCVSIQASRAGQHIPGLPTTLLRTHSLGITIYYFQWQVNCYSSEKWCHILHCHKLSGLCISCWKNEEVRKKCAVMDRAGAATLPPYCWWSNVHHKSSKGKKRVGII